MNYLTKINVSIDQMFSLGLVDNYKWHQCLWSCFEFNPQQNRDFLTRIDFNNNLAQVLLLSKRKPICPSWCPASSFFVKEISPSFLSHRNYVFDLKANPTKAIKQEETNKHSKRIPIRNEELKGWLERKAASGGFTINDTKELDISPITKNYFCKKNNFVYHSGVTFKGLLTVIDNDLFKQTYSQGIGSAKGFGFGLLLLSPIS